MGGKGGGGGSNALAMYNAQPEPVGRADPIDLTQQLQYINAQKAAAAASAPPPLVLDDTPNEPQISDALVKSVLAPPQYWFNQPVSTLEAQPQSKRKVMTTINDNSGSV